MAFNQDEIPPLLQSSLLGLLAERQKPVGTSRSRRLKRGMLNAPPGNAFEPNIPAPGPRGFRPAPVPPMPAVSSGEPPDYGQMLNPLLGIQPQQVPTLESQYPLEQVPYSPDQVLPTVEPPDNYVAPMTGMQGNPMPPAQPQQPAPMPMLGMQGSPTPYSVPSVPRETAPAAMPAQPTSDDTWMAFLAAGLGILANNTGHYGAAGPAIGKGGLMGLQMFQQVRQNKQNEAYRQQQIKLHEQQLARQYEQMNAYKAQVDVQNKLAGLQIGKDERLAAHDKRGDELLQTLIGTTPGSQEESIARRNYMAHIGKLGELIRQETSQEKKSAFEEKAQAVAADMVAADPSTSYDDALRHARSVIALKPMLVTNDVGQQEIVDLARRSLKAQMGGVGAGGAMGGTPKSAPQYKQGPAASPDIAEADVTEGTGISGAWGGFANKVADFFSGLTGSTSLPYPEVEKAKNLLMQLRNQTIAVSSMDIPGRPSNWSMQTLGVPETIDPNSIFQGDMRTIQKLKSVREAIARDLERIDSDILRTPKSFKRETVSAARDKHSKMTQLLYTYDRLLAAIPAASKPSAEQFQR